MTLLRVGLISAAVAIPRESLTLKMASARFVKKLQKLSAFYTAYYQKPKPHIKLQQQNPRDWPIKLCLHPHICFLSVLILSIHLFCTLCEGRCHSISFQECSKFSHPFPSLSCSGDIVVIIDCQINLNCFTLYT